MMRTLVISLSLLLLYSGACCLCFFFISKSASDGMRHAISDRVSFYETYSALDGARLNLLTYCNSLSPDALTRYEGYVAALEEDIGFLEPHDQPTIDIYAGLLDRFVDAGQTTIEAIRSGDPETAQSRYEHALNIALLATEYRSYIEPDITDDVMARVAIINKTAAGRLSLLWVLIAASFAAQISIGVHLIRRFLAPIASLTAHAKRIDFDHLEPPSPTVMRRDETGVLVSVFGQMVERIRCQVEELHHKRELERRLEQERIKRAETESQLAKSRVKVFQSQINAHFLFNSFNMVAKLAYIEDAPRAQHAAELIARFLRSVLNQFDREITLAEEFACVDLYVEIQKLRFGDRIRFERELDESCANQIVFSMIVQPLVENALSHGVGSFGEGGIIRYYARKTEEGITIGVEDNGLGFTDRQRTEILDAILKERAYGDAQHGIGLTNVYKRLSIAFPGMVEPCIHSVPHQSTRVEFRLRITTMATSGDAG